MCEYWVDQDGYVTYCDGDAGVDVANHEGIARRWAMRKVFDALQALDDPLAAAIHEVVQAHLDDDGVPDCISLRCSLADLDAFSGDETSIDAITRLTGLPEMEVRFAMQAEPNDVDVRDHAMREWGWHRVICKRAHYTIDSWQVTRTVIKRMYFPIGEIEEECNVGVPTWTWYVHKTKRQFEISNADMESGIIPRAEVR